MRDILEIQKKAFIENGQPTYNQRLDSLKRCIALLETHDEQIIETLNEDFKNRSHHEIMTSEVIQSIRNLNFYEPDFKKFPGLKLGWEALQNPYCSPIVLNASNEIAVDAFLTQKIKFTEIYNIVYETLNCYNPSIPNSIEDVIEIDKISRINSSELVKRRL